MASGPGLIAGLLSRQGRVTLFCMLALAALAWGWLWRNGTPEAGGGMADMPGMHDMGMASPLPSPDIYVANAFLMWAIMMVAMMLPSAAPIIQLHEVFSRKRTLGRAGTWAFAASYLALWIAFALLAALAQWALVGAGAADAMSLAIGSRRIAALLLLAAGLYELSPWKRICLAQCQTPVQFLMRHWRSGVAGAAAMGLKHGAYCVGCCWALMLLLFVGGVMNLAWIALLTFVVVVEKYAPVAWRMDLILAALLIGAALVLAFA